MADKLVDGVYCTHRSQLAVRVKELVSDLSPALNRLSGMRGLAARVVAECDEELREIIRHLRAAPDAEADLVASLRRGVIDSNNTQIQEIKHIEDLDLLLGHHAISSGLLFKEVHRRIGNVQASDEVRSLRRSLGRYPELVLSRRNILAHALEERTTNGWRIARRNPHPDLTVQDFADFRADFLSHLRNVRLLRSLLVGQEPE